MVKLQYNKRSDETPNYYKILNNEKLPCFNYENREPQQFNICKTNMMRKHINDLMMDKNGLLLEADLSLNAYSQDTANMRCFCLHGLSRLFELSSLGHSRSTTACCWGCCAAGCLDRRCVPRCTVRSVSLKFVTRPAGTYVPTDLPAARRRRTTRRQAAS